MPKSANDFYADKMRRLLEKQAQIDAARRSQQRRLPPPGQAQKTGAASGASSRDYYDSFRTKSTQIQGGADAAGQAVGKTGGQAAKRPYAAPRANAAGGAPKKKAPEQTVRDRREEEQRRLESLRKARRGRRLRKLRDGIVSFVLIVAVFSVLCVVVYRLLFVIKDISANDTDSYTGEEIVTASGVGVGDHLYSFSSRIIGEKIMMNCPEIDSVDVVRHAPNTIAFDVTEESAAYFADFYGEIREITPSLRVLGATSEQKAREKGLVKLKLPAVREAIAGKSIVFAAAKSSEYIKSVLAALDESTLKERIGTVNLENRYGVKMSCDGRFLFLLGDSSKMETKLRIADAVLADGQTFKAEDKAQLDLSDLSQTSVIIDNQLAID